MNLKEKIIISLTNFYDSGEPLIEMHLMKLMMWYSKCESDLMELSHNDHNEFKAIIPEIVEIVISDFQKNYYLVPENSERHKRFIIRRTELFNKNLRFNVLLTVSDFDLLMDALDVEYRKNIHDTQFNNRNKEQSISNLTSYQETILLETKNIFDNKINVDFIEKRKKFLKNVFPKIEELYRKHPDHFEEISSKIHSIMYKEEVSQITSFLKNQEFRAYQIYSSEISDILRAKYVSLENSGNKRLCRFLIDYEKSIQNWRNGENGSKAILKDINKEDGPCYIATMVYGDYNHPSVIKLRIFRDNSLNKTYLGKRFISLYYKTSPILVRKIKNNNRLHKMIKLILDKVIQNIKY